MTRVFVSGCYDILHGGHIEFFHQARAFGDHLTVCFASDEVYRAWKGREPALPEDSRRAILEELRCVDSVVTSGTLGGMAYFDFAEPFIEAKADVLVITDDDLYKGQKTLFAQQCGAICLIVPKRSRYARVSTSEIRKRIAMKGIVCE